MTESGTGRPPVTLRRYSGISDAVSGVPCASRRTARAISERHSWRSRTMVCLAVRVHFLHQSDYILNRRLGQNAVSKVENVSTPAGGRIDYLARSFAYLRLRSKQYNWVEIPLHGKF